MREVLTARLSFQKLHAKTSSAAPSDVIKSTNSLLITTTHPGEVLSPSRFCSGLLVEYVEGPLNGLFANSGLMFFLLFFFCSVLFHF